MAVREFTDETGRAWRVWEVVPEELHPQTKQEDYLAVMYHTGWLVFETKSEDEKRRLSPIPADWSSLAGEELAGLLQQAEPVSLSRFRARSETGGESPTDASAPATRELGRQSARPDVSDLGVVRIFRYPDGQLWMACVVQKPSGRDTPVLRFSAGTREVDVAEYPRDWADYQDEQLIALLRRASPRTEEASPAPDTQHRRWDDLRR